MSIGWPGLPFGRLRVSHAGWCEIMRCCILLQQIRENYCAVDRIRQFFQTLAERNRSCLHRVRSVACIGPPATDCWTAGGNSSECSPAVFLFDAVPLLRTQQCCSRNRPSLRRSVRPTDNSPTNNRDTRSASQIASVRCRKRSARQSRPRSCQTLHEVPAINFTAESESVRQAQQLPSRLPLH